MPSMPGTFRPQGARTRAETKREADGRRGSARARGYTSAWDRAAKAYLAEHPLCEYALAEDPPRVVASTLVDHLYPHRGDADLFWDRGNWVATSKDFHDGPKQAAERAGKPAIDDLARRLGRPTR